VILNPENLCACGEYKGRTRQRCLTCNAEHGRVAGGGRGRPQRVSDEQILAAVRAGGNTPDRLLATLEMKSKTNLMRRLRDLEAAGLVTIIERQRYLGFTILPRDDD